MDVLGASPLRLYGPESIVNVLCPVKSFHKTIDEAMRMRKRELPFKLKNGKIVFNKKSRCYIEMQGQLHVTGIVQLIHYIPPIIYQIPKYFPIGRKKAYLIVWLEKEFTIKKMVVDHTFWNNHMKNKLEHFFNAAMIKELANPRSCRQMKLREYDPQTKTFV